MRDGTFQRSLEEIDQDIAIQNYKKNRVVPVTDTRTRIEADVLQAKNILEADAALILLVAEFDARILTR